MSSTKALKSRFLLCLLNPWSACNKADKIREFIIDHEIDILALTETWLTGTVCDEPIISALLPEGYSLIHTPRNGRGGGTAVVHRDNVAVSLVNNDQSWSSFELTECLIKSSKCVRLSVVYRPPSASNRAAFLDEFSDYLSQLVTCTGEPLIVGDFNLHMNVSADRDAAEFLSVLSSTGLMQHVSTSTYRNSHTLDLVISKLNSQLVDWWRSTDEGFPDHFPVYAELSMTKPSFPRQQVTSRKIRGITQDSLRAAVLATPLVNNTRLNSLSLDEMVAMYNDELRSIMNVLAPLKTRTLVIRPDSKWHTDAIRMAKQRRRQAERRWRKSGLVVHREMYLHERNNVNSVIACAKKQYYRNKIEACGADSKQLFNIVSSLLGRAQSSPLPSGDASDIATMFSDYFITKISTIQASIPTSGLLASPLSPRPDVTSVLDRFILVGDAAMVNVISRSSSKYCDLDPMPTHLLKLIQTELCPVLTGIINASLSQGVFPEKFKSAIVRPSLKKASLDREVGSSYRPISNLSFLSKILERIVVDQLLGHLQRNRLFEPMQSAYRPHHSSETALLKVQNDLVHAMSDGKVVALAMLDLSAAFDTVNHDILLTTLESLGVRASALHWFGTYLRGRRQQVSISGSCSSERSLSCGVPQGSVLGPILFNLYTWSLGHLLRQHGVMYHMYADDLQIYVASMPTDLHAALSRLENCIAHVQT